MEPPSAARDEDEVDADVVVVVVVVVGEKADDDDKLVDKDAARSSRIAFVPRSLRPRHEQVITRPAGPPRPPIPAKACRIHPPRCPRWSQASLKVEISRRAIFRPPCKQDVLWRV